MRSLLCTSVLVVLLSAVVANARLSTHQAAASSNANQMIVGSAQMKQIKPNGTSYADHKAAVMASANEIFNIVVTENQKSGTPLDLIVFPEYELYGGLSFIGCLDKQKKVEIMSPYCEPIPGWIANYSMPMVDLSQMCGNVTAVANSPLLTIACSAAASAPTTAISYNACEQATDATTGETIFYNTQVVLQNATLITKYRKFHPWATECFNTPQLQLATFTLPTKPVIPGVSNFTFGLFTCLDILFPRPKEILAREGQVKYFSYSSQIPLVGREAVEGFSWANNVTVVASNGPLGSSSVLKDGKPLAECNNKDIGCVAKTTLVYPA